ncbi:hypothetical protein C8J35_103524 [Rhizobium sp. PP-F2F-G38]|nr:hypothetical protein C8J35_103524 [Rhizobium sp. PP-F2F-G38]
MADISFDDLIPTKAGQPTAAAPAPAMTFDDLIPQEASSQPSAQPQRVGRHMTFEEGQALLDQEGAQGSVGAALTGLVDGVPIAGPAMLGGAQRGAAALSSLINDRSYDQNLQQAQALTSEAQEKHPYITTGANVAGAIGGTIPMVAAAPAAFGGGAGSLALRSGISMLSGGAVGGADAGVRSDWDADAMTNGALWGGGMGLTGPTVGKAVGSGVRAVTNAIRDRMVAKAAGTTSGALSNAARAMEADGIDAAALRSRLNELGPNGMIADVGPNLQGQAAALANMPGPGQQIMRTALDARHAGANARIGSTIDETLGPNVIPSRVDASIAESQRALSPLYDEAMRNARAVDTTPIAHELESQAVNLRGDAQKAVQRIRSMLNVVDTDVLDPNPGTLFQTRQAIDGMMTTEANPAALRAMAAARSKIDDELTKAVPGIKDADAAYAQLARQREGLQRGQTVLSSGREAPRPAELAQEVYEGAQPQGRLLGPSAVPFRMSQGARAEVDRIVGGNANDVAALNRLIKSEGDWNRDRLASLFGEEKADRLFKVLDNERTFAKTRDFATGNSATAGRQQAMKDLGGSGEGLGFRDVYAAGGAAGVARQAGVKAVDKVFGALLYKRRLAGNASLAEAITSNQDEIVDALAKIGTRAAPSPSIDLVVKSLLLGGGTSGAR